jgi:hypothetical protein
MAVYGLLTALGVRFSQWGPREALAVPPGLSRSS